MPDAFYKHLKPVEYCPLWDGSTVEDFLVTSADAPSLPREVNSKLPGTGKVLGTGYLHAHMARGLCIHALTSEQ